MGVGRWALGFVYRPATPHASPIEHLSLARSARDRGARRRRAPGYDRAAADWRSTRRSSASTSGRSCRPRVPSAICRSPTCGATCTRRARRVSSGRWPAMAAGGTRWSRCGSPARPRGTRATSCRRETCCRSAMRPGGDSSCGSSGRSSRRTALEGLQLRRRRLVTGRRSGCSTSPRPPPSAARRPRRAARGGRGAPAVPASAGTTRDRSPTSPTARPLAACGSSGSTSISDNPRNASAGTHARLINSVSGATAVTADFKCRQPRTGTARTV